MWNHETITARVVALATAGALSLGMLAACGGTAKETTTENKDTQEQVATEDTAAKDDETTTAEDATTSTQAADADVIDVGAFTFQLPASWVGKVETTVTTGDAPSAMVTLPGNSDAILASLALCEGEEPMAAGDIASHLAGYVTGEGTHVEVWTRNWPWFAATGATPDTISEDELRTLVDLSTGGAVAYDDVVGVGEKNTGTEEPDFARAELVPTVVIK